MLPLFLLLLGKGVQEYLQHTLLPSVFDVSFQSQNVDIAFEKNVAELVVFITGSFYNFSKFAKTEHFLSRSAAPVYK